MDQIERIPSEKLLARALTAFVEFKAQITARPGLRVSDPEVIRALKFASVNAFSIRELSDWLNRSGVPITPTTLFRKINEHGTCDFIERRFEDMEEAIRWIAFECTLPVDVTQVFVNAIIGGALREKNSRISSEKLMEVSANTFRTAMNDAVQFYYEALKNEKASHYGFRLDHIETLKNLGNADEAEVAQILRMAQKMHQRPIKG